MGKKDTGLVGAEDARGLLEKATPGPWRSGWDCADTGEDVPLIYSVSPDPGGHDGKVVFCMWYDGPRTACTEKNAALIAAAPDLARTVIALHARAEQAERERDEAIDLLEGIPTWGPYRWRDVPDTVRLKLRGNSDQIGRLIKERDAARVFLDAEINANVRWAAQAERDLLRRLWHRIDGDQDGDAPSAVEMEDGLVRLFDDMRADVERCAADENASTEEAERLREERDRLRDVVEHAARTGSDATFRVAVCKGAGSGEKLALVVTGPADREESMARSVGGIICATMSLAMDERDVELRDAVAERDRLAREVKTLRDVIVTVVDASEETTDRSTPDQYEAAMQAIADACYDVAKVSDWRREHVEAADAAREVARD